MPRGSSSAAKTLKNRLAASTMTKLAGAKKKQGSDGSEEKKRKTPRFSNATLAVRAIRRAQKDTNLFMRYAPIRRLVCSIARDVYPATRMRLSTVKALQEVTEAAVVSIMGQAMNRRTENLTPAAMRKQHTVQVMERHLRGAFGTWAHYHAAGSFVNQLNNIV